MNWSKFKDFFSIERRTKYFTHVLVYLLLTSIAVFSLLIVGQDSQENKRKQPTKKIIDAFENIQIEAKSAVVWDVINHREIFAKNSNMPLPLASLTKVMTAITANGRLEDEQEIQITKEDLKPEGDSKLIVGDIWNVGDLRDFTLLTSSNDGAFALAAVAESRTALRDQMTNTQAQFIQEMNQKAKEIGLLNSKFFNEHGLDREADMGGAYGSAHDMALLFEYAIKNHPKILEATRYKNLQFNSNEAKYLAQNTNNIIDKIPGIIASKTGYTDLAGGNLVIAFDAGLNRPIIIGVLGSSEQGRFSDISKLVEATLRYIQND